MCDTCAQPTLAALLRSHKDVSPGRRLSAPLPASLHPTIAFPSAVPGGRSGNELGPGGGTALAGALTALTALLYLDARCPCERGGGESGIGRDEG